MNYTQNQFFRLMEAVEDQGGDHLDEACEDRSFEFTGERPQNPVVTYCGESALFVVPYDGSEAVTIPSYPERAEGDEPMKMSRARANGPAKLFERPSGGGGEVKACAVDDSMGLWPRFADQVAG